MCCVLMYVSECVCLVRRHVVGCVCGGVFEAICARARARHHHTQVS